jgi:hypothetical protein
MRIFFQKTVAHSRNIDGKKKTEFEVIKGKNQMVHQIKGVSLNNNPDTYDVSERIKVLNRNSGKIASKEHQYRMKSENILSLLRDGDMSHKSNVKKNTSNNIKKINIVPKTKKAKVIEKTEVKKEKSVKAVKKVEVKKEKPVKVVKKVEAKEKKPVRKMVVKAPKNNK